MITLENLVLESVPSSYFHEVIKHGKKMSVMYGPIFKSEYQQNLIYHYASELDLVASVAKANNYSDRFPEILTSEHNDNLDEGYPYKAVYKIVCSLEKSASETK